MAYITTEVDVDLSDFDTDDLLDELESRNELPAFQAKQMIESIYLKRRIGQDYQKELDNLIYEIVGRII
jgi:hypothetical protein